MSRLTAGLTQRGMGFLIAGAMLCAGGLLLGQPDLTRIGVLLLALLVGAHLVGRLRPTELATDRTVRPARLGVDDAAVVTVSMRNTGNRRTSLAMAEEELPPQLGDRPRFLVPPTGVGAVRDLEYTVLPHVRGVHPLGPLRIRIQDPFGLTSVPVPAQGRGSVLVVPRIHPLASTRQLGPAVGTEGSIPHQVALRGEDDASIRGYREGDDLRRIHWPATARTGELMVRQEDRPARRRAVVLLDSRTSAHGGRGREDTFEWAVTMAASITAHVADLGYAVQLLSADASADSGVRCDDSLDDVLETLARIGKSADDELRALLHGAHSLAGSGGLVVAIVGGTQDDAARALCALRQSGGTAIAFVVDPSGRPQASGRAAATAATLSAAGWLTRSIDVSLPLALQWSAVASSTLVGAGR